MTEGRREGSKVRKAGKEGRTGRQRAREERKQARKEIREERKREMKAGRKKGRRKERKKEEKWNTGKKTIKPRMHKQTQKPER